MTHFHSIEMTHFQLHVINMSSTWEGSWAHRLAWNGVCVLLLIAALCGSALAVCCMLCVAVCYNVLLCVAVCCCVLLCVAETTCSEQISWFLSCCPKTRRTFMSAQTPRLRRITEEVWCAPINVLRGWKFQVSANARIWSTAMGQGFLRDPPAITDGFRILAPVLQCVVVYCSVLQYVAACWSVGQCVAVGCRGLKESASSSSLIRRRRGCAMTPRLCNTLQHTATHCNALPHILQHNATHCSTLQHNTILVWCSIS